MTSQFRPAAAVAAPRGAERVPELDALRGIAAFAVLLQHARLTFPPVELPDIPGLGFLAWTVLHHTPLRAIEAGRPAVMFFFVLSGFVLTLALLRQGSPGLPVFAAQRSARLLLPVAAAVAFSVGLYWLFFDPAVLADPELRHHGLGGWEAPPTAEVVLRHLLLWGTDHDFTYVTPLWSLVHEWRISIFLPLVLLFRGGPRQVALLLVIALAMMALGATRFDEDRMQLGPTIFHTFAGSLYFVLPFAMGAALALLGPPRLESRGERLAAGVAVLALLSMESDAFVYLGSVALIVLAMAPGRFRSVLRTPPLLWLGRVSFSLYLVHVPVLVACVHALHDSLPLPAVTAIAVVLSLLAAWAMRELAEAPAQRLSRRIGTLAGARAGTAKPAAPDLAPPEPVALRKGR